MSDVKLESLRKEYGPVVACNSISTTFDSSSLTCLLGPSGCGKTTLLRIIAGLEQPDSGRVLFDGEDVTRYSPSRRNIGMVFQYPVVYKGLTVFENLELPLLQMPRRERPNAKARKAWVDSLLDLLNLAPKANVSVDALDNGSRQTVAVGRAVVRKPKIVIFDEPVTNVDVDSKIHIQRGIKLLSKEIGQTILYVTHDQREAMTLADRIILLQDGNILESADPGTAYRSPSSMFGGYFLGSPGMNFLDARISVRDGCHEIHCALFNAPVRARFNADQAAGGVKVGIRAEEIAVFQNEHDNAVPAQVRSCTLTAGGRWFLDCRIGGRENVRVLTSPDYAPGEATTVWLNCRNAAVRLFSSAGNKIESTGVAQGMDGA
jgi:ABC-type sugar transport system ATPase subunit